MKAFQVVGNPAWSEMVGLADLPLYTLRQKAAPNAIRKTTDPGRALITGVWADVNKFKAPALRGLAGHAPYFHNGSAATLEDVIDAYEAAGSSSISLRRRGRTSSPS